MKALVNPPINAILLLLGLLFFFSMLWNLGLLQGTTLTKDSDESLTVIELPSAETLAVPALQQFSHMMKTPLFWQERQIIQAAKVVSTTAQPVAVINTKVPEGRLIGFIDTGSERFALIKDKEGSRRLREKDAWEGWTVASLDPQKMVLQQGSKKHELILISNEAPKASKNKKTANQKRRQVSDAKRGRKQQPSHSVAKKQQSAVTMSPEKIEKMRAARHKLLQARWGKTENDNQTNK